MQTDLNESKHECGYLFVKTEQVAQKKEKWENYFCRPEIITTNESADWLMLMLFHKHSFTAIHLAPATHVNLPPTHTHKHTELAPPDKFGTKVDFASRL